MIVPPVSRIPNIMVITQKFKGQDHRGIDLRTQMFVPKWGLQWIQVTEDSQVLRYGEDKYGNDFIVVRPLQTQYYEIKYIHVTLIQENLEKGKILPAKTKLGKSQLKGNSKGHHLYFEVLDDKNKWIDPLQYFIENNINFKLKENL